MARQQVQGVLRLAFLTSISSQTAPTAAELNAGVDLTGFSRADGIDTPQNVNAVDTASVQSKYDTQAVGTRGGDMVQVQMYRDDTTDTAYSTLAPDTTGFLVVRRFGVSTTAFATGNKVEVWPVTVGTRGMDKTAKNAAQTFTAQFVVTSPPTEIAVVA